MYRYRPGQLLAVARPRAVAVLPADTPEHVRAEVYAALESAGLGEVIDALVVSFGVSVTALPAFAIAIEEEGGTRVAVRGSIGAFAGAPVSGAQVTTWSEVVAQAGTAVVLGALEPAAASHGDLLLADGMAWVATISAEADATAPAPVGHTTRTPEPDDDMADREDNPGHDATDAAAEGPSLDTEFGGLWGAEPSPRPAPTTPAPLAAPNPPSPPAPQAAPSTPTAPAAPTAPSTSSATIGEAPAASPEPAVSDGGQAAAEVPAPPPAVPTAAQTARAQAPAPAPETPTEHGMISGVPDFARVSAPSEPAPSEPAPSVPAPSEPVQPELAMPEPAPLGDHDGATITAAQARALAAQSTPQPSGATTGAADQAPVLAYGRARVSTGQDITLDRTVIIGRRPKATRITGEPPHLVAVPSPQQDISRNHVELRVEGTAVVAVDLDTTNGSLLRRGTAEPVRLHPHEPAVIVSGDILDLGDGITVAFEEIP